MWSVLEEELSGWDVHGKDLCKVITQTPECEHPATGNGQMTATLCSYFSFGEWGGDSVVKMPSVQAFL